MLGTGEGVGGQYYLCGVGAGFGVDGRDERVCRVGGSRDKIRCSIVRRLEKGAFRKYVQKRLFDEERAVRREGEGELFGHRLVYTAVEVDAGVHAKGFDGAEALDGWEERRGRVQPAQV